MKLDASLAADSRFFSAMVALFGRNCRRRLKANVLAVQAWIATAFPSSSCLTSQSLRAARSGTGRGQGPQPRAAGYRARDPPPLACISLCRRFPYASLRGRRPHRGADRPGLGAMGEAWTLAAWTFLPGIGPWASIGPITSWLGRLVVLGPGRNASFMPWLAGTALLHSPWSWRSERR